MSSVRGAGQLRLGRKRAAKPAQTPLQTVHKLSVNCPQTGRRPIADLADIVSSV